MCIMIALLFMMTSSGNGQNWTLAIHELDDAPILTSKGGWNTNSVFYSCDAVSPPFQNYLTQAAANPTLTRNVDLSSLGSFSQMKISFELIIIGEKLLATTFNFKVKLGAIEVYSEQSAVSNQPNSKSYCSVSGNEDIYKTITIEQDWSQPIFQLVLQQTGVNQMTFGIRNFRMFLKLCEQNCMECEQSTCLQCMPTFTQIGNHCRCALPYGFYHNGGCVYQCPLGTYAINNYECQPYSSITTILNKFSEITLTTDDFEFLGDVQYSVINTTPHVMTIDGVSAAGPFRNNDGIKFNIGYTTPCSIIVSGTLFILGPSELYTNVELLLNNYHIAKVINYGTMRLVQGAIIQSEITCIQSLFSQCNRVLFTITLNNIDRVDNLQLIGHFNTKHQRQGWAIRELKIQVVVPLVTPSPPILCPYTHKGSCVITCPYHSQLSGTICVDFDSVFQRSYYFLQGFDSITKLTESSVLGGSIRVGNMYHNYYFSQFLLDNRIMFGGINWWSNLKYENEFNYINYPHYAIRFMIRVLLIDVSTTDTFQYKINGGTPVTVTILDPIVTPYSLQVGQRLQDYTFQIDLTFPHTKKQLDVTFTCLSNGGWCALFDYYIIVAQCSQLCSECIGPLSTDCVTFEETQLSTLGQCKVGYYYHSTEYQCQPCDQGCDTCSSTNSCLTCFPNQVRYNNKCYCSASLTPAPFKGCNGTMCQPGCLVCSNDGTCQQCDVSSHRWLNINQCLCLPGYFENNQKTCKDCYPICKTCAITSKQCLSCYPEQKRELQFKGCECIPGYFELSGGLTCQQCDQYCATCAIKSTICKSCSGFAFRVLSGKKCICMNGYFDAGVVQCQKCSPLCQTCSDINTCLTCYSDQQRQLSISMSACVCQIGYFEVLPALTCAQCHLTCEQCRNSILPSMCKSCPITREPATQTAAYECKCKRGFYDIGEKQCRDCREYVDPPTTHYCYSYCSDGIVQWNEDCDDANGNPRDGCTSCLFSDSTCLDKECQTCFAGKCIDCIDGYYLDKNSRCQVCDAICKTCVKQANNCSKCTIQTPQGCLQCVNERGFVLQDGKCSNICGDGLVVEGEQCDDGNLKDGDGCNQNCQLETGWICQESCEAIHYPKILLEEDQYDSEALSRRNVRMTVNQQLQISGSIQNNLEFSIVNCPDCKLAIIDMTQYDILYSDLVVDIDITLSGSLENPIMNLMISKPDNFQNKQGVSFQNSTYQLELLSYNPVQDSVVAATEGLMTLAQYILYLMLGLAVLAFLFGGLHIFWNLLDMLQLLSYLKYLNVQYPYNVTYYFTLFGFAEFDFLKQYIDIETFISQYVDTPDADPKFKQEGYSSVFIVNIVAVITVFMITILTFIAGYILFKLVQKIAHRLTLEIIDDCDESFHHFILFRIARNTQMSLYHLTTEFKSALIRAFMGISFDLNIAIFLQLKDFNTHSKILLFSGILTIFTLCLQIYLVYEGFRIMGYPKYFFKLKSTETNFGPLYEGIKLRQNSYSNIYNIIQVVKKISFMLFLVLLYDQPCFQIAMVSLLNLALTVFVILVRPMDDSYEFYKVLSCELIIWIIEMLALIFGFNDQSHNLNNDDQLTIGWVIIGLCTLLILIQLIIDVKQHASYLISKYTILQKLILRLLHVFSKVEAEQESNIFIKRRRVVGSMKSNDGLSSRLKLRKTVTFTISSNNS